MQNTNPTFFVESKLTKTTCKLEDTELKAAVKLTVSETFATLKANA